MRVVVPSGGLAPDPTGVTPAAARPRRRRPTPGIAIHREPASARWGTLRQSMLTGAARSIGAFPRPLSLNHRALLNTYLVEDSPVIREQLIATLEELVPVHVVGAAGDEHSALHWLAQAGARGVDLVIVDLFLASGSGLGVLRGVQELPRRFRLVVLSNFATPEMRSSCLALGADRVFDKSTEIDALVAYCAQLAAGDGASLAAPA